MRALASLLAAFAAAAPFASLAEKADREKEIVVGADHLTADDANRTSTFEGNVIVTQGTMRMTAKRVTVKEDANRHKFYVAYGEPVTFRQKRDNVDEYVEGYALRAEFDDLNDVVKLFDKARVKSNQNELTGNYIQYDMRRELAEVQGAPPGTTPPPNSRVKVTIIPAKKDSPPAKGGTAAPPEGPPAPVPALKPDAGPGTR
ncbi:MAG TPA: lipopolysaccharide transport periplasmic protein LptA [Usitatibacter sp.]|jgi:lipopolysaccharide export system protein LptA|nr:lipopolysaccharide transport periplasmic protein LptA [Usitatibacter sp.]